MIRILKQLFLRKNKEDKKIDFFSTLGVSLFNNSEYQNNYCIMNNINKNTGTEKKVKNEEKEVVDTGNNIELENSNNIKKNKNNEIIDSNYKEIKNMDIYLVVLDTTNRPEVVDRGLKGGLKNFYFVYASKQEDAIVKVLATFARYPKVVDQIQYSLKAIPIKNILDIIGEKIPLWSYIPFSKNQRFPGQRSTPPQQKINPVNNNEIIPMKPEEILPPITPPTQNDVDIEEYNKIKSHSKKNEDDSKNNEVKELLTKLVSLLQNNNLQNNNLQNNNLQNNNVSHTENVNVYKVKNPEDDKELLARMQEVLNSAKPKHINAVDNDEFLNQEVEKNNLEVKKFRNLSPEEIEQKNKEAISDILKEK